MQVKELKGTDKDEIEVSGEALQEKEFAILGFRFFDSKTLMNISYSKDSKKMLRDFLQSNEIYYLKIKHKSEPNYNQLIAYKNFYPTDIDFGDKDNVEGVKYNKKQSNYRTQFWKDPSFPNMQPVFSTFFKDDLKEKENLK